MIDKLQECSLYRHFDKEGNLLYVGISLSVLARLSQHKDSSHWYNQISEVKIEHFSSRIQAIEAEREAIYTENPIHNVMRPKSLSAIENHANNSRKDLLGRITAFKPIYTPQEVADLYQVSLNTVNSWIRENRLGSVVVGTRTTRFGQRDVIRVTGWNLITFMEMQMDENLKDAA